MFKTTNQARNLGVVMDSDLNFNVHIKGVFTPVFFSPIKSNSGPFSPFVRFVWAGVNTVMALGCGPRPFLEEAVSVRSQSYSGTVCLWWERDLTQLPGVLRKFELNGSCSQVCFAFWDAAEHANCF